MRSKTARGDTISDNGTLNAGLAGAVPLAGTGGLTAYLSGHKHNRGRRALGALAGGAVAGNVGSALGGMASRGHLGTAIAAGMLGKGLGAAAGNELVDRATKHERQGRKHAAREKDRGNRASETGTLQAGLAGAIPLAGTGTLGAALSGHKHNRGRRALGALGGGALGATVGGVAGGVLSRGNMLAARGGGMLGKGLGAAAGNELVDRATRHERQGKKHAAAECFEPLERELGRVFASAVWG